MWIQTQSNKHCTISYLNQRCSTNTRAPPWTLHFQTATCCPSLWSQQHCQPSTACTMQHSVWSDNTNWQIWLAFFRLKGWWVDVTTSMLTGGGGNTLPAGEQGWHDWWPYYSHAAVIHNIPSGGLPVLFSSEAKNLSTVNTELNSQCGPGNEATLWPQETCTSRVPIHCGNCPSNWPFDDWSELGSQVVAVKPLFPQRVSSALNIVPETIRLFGKPLSFNDLNRWTGSAMLAV